MFKLTQIGEREESLQGLTPEYPAPPYPLGGLPDIHKFILQSPYLRSDPSMADVVAMWDIALSDGIHKIQFEHGTTSGKRIITIDGKEFLRRNWMFKLVGKETFHIGKHKGVVHIEAVTGFAYEYVLEIDGKSLKQFIKHRAKTAKVWTPMINGDGHRIVFEKDTMDVWCDGEVLDTAGEFVDDGTEIHFAVAGKSCYIKAVSSGNRREGIVHSLVIDDQEVPLAVE